MKKIWLISDTHFNHNNMLKYCGRPGNFNELIWKNLSQIEDDDILIHLGDICIGDDIGVHYHLQSLLDCKKILVLGNHDHKSTNWYMEHGWDFVCDSFTWNIHGKNIIFSHHPVEIGEDSINIHGHFHNNLPRLLAKEWVVEDEEERNKHELGLLTDRHKLIACELMDYKPVLLDKIANG